VSFGYPPEDPNYNEQLGQAGSPFRSLAGVGAGLLVLVAVFAVVALVLWLR